MLLAGSANNLISMNYSSRHPIATLTAAPFSLDVLPQILLVLYLSLKLYHSGYMVEVIRGVILPFHCLFYFIKSQE